MTSVQKISQADICVRHVGAFLQNSKTAWTFRRGKKKSILDQCWCRYSIEYLKYTANDGWSMKFARLIVTLLKGREAFVVLISREIKMRNDILVSSSPCLPLTFSRLVFPTSVSKFYQTINRRTWSLDQTKKESVSTISDPWIFVNHSGDSSCSLEIDRHQLSTL